MRRIRREESPSVMSEINVTPLTDMALVLLIIFMVTTPLILQGGIKVKLPSAATADSKEIEASIVVSLALDNKLYVDDKPAEMENLLAVLKQKTQNVVNPAVVINADQGVTHGQVVRILDIAKRAGIARLAIAAERIDEKEFLKGEK